MLVLYSAFAIFVIGIITLILISYFNKTLSKEINISNKRFLTQVQIAADTRLANLQSFIFERFVSINRENSINTFLSGSATFDPAMIVDLYGIVSDYAQHNNFIDSIYIYRISDDTLISSREGVVFNASDPDNYNQRYIKVDPIQKVMASNDNVYWNSPRENSKVWSDRPVLTLAYSLPLYKSAAEKTGAVIVNIDEQRFLEAINQYTRMDYDLGIINQAGDILAHSDKNALNGTAHDLPFMNEMAERKEGFTTVQLDGHMQGVSWISSTIHNWKYISVTPIEALNKQLSVAKQFAVAILIAVVLFTLAGLRIITKNVHKPIRQLMNTAAGKFNLSYDNMNEITFIDKVITSLSSRMEEMEGTIQHNQPVIRHKMLFDLLINGDYGGTEEEIREKLKVAGVEWKHDGFLIMATEIQPKELVGLSPKQREFVIFTLMEAIDGYFTGESSCRSISVSQNRIVSVVNFDSSEKILREPHLLLELCNEHAGLKCNMAISEHTPQISGLQHMYKQTDHYLQYGFICGYGRLFTPELVHQQENDGKYMEPDVFDELLSHLKTSKKTQLTNQLTFIFNFLQEEKVSYMYVQNILMQVLTIFSHAVQERRIEDSELDKHTMLAKLREMESLEDCRQWFLSLAARYTEWMSARVSSIDEQFVANISQYIVDNIDKDISLNSVAEQFHITANYLSKIFKESTGVNFSSFVTGHKLQKARELLINDKKMNITDVANSLGYYNLPYFSMLFKEKYGVTPVKFRKEHAG